MEKNIKMTVKNASGDYDTLFPETKTSNVTDSQGQDVDTIVIALTNKINTLQSTIDDHINPFSMTLYSDRSIAELGNTINSITFTWYYNRSPFSQSFEGIALSAAARGYTYVNAVTNTKTFTLSAVPSEGGVAKTATTTLKFMNGIYYGVSASTDYDSPLVLSLGNKELSENKARTISVNADQADQYIYYCIPSRLGPVSFKVGGFDGGFVNVATIPFVNSYGYSESYDIYRSDNPGLGYIDVVIQ